MKDYDFLSVPHVPVGRRPQPLAAATPEVPEGQPTWCRKITSSLPFSVTGPRDEHGDRTYLPAGVPVRLVLASFDDDGTCVWEIPADSWREGDIIQLGPLPEGHSVYWAVHAPNGGRS